MADWSFSFQESTDASKCRHSFRITPWHVTVTVEVPEQKEEESEHLPVDDISADGLHMVTAQDRFQIGQILTLTIYLCKQCCIKNLEAKVVRLTERGCAVAFINLTRHQELRLDKIVLEMQKRVIEQHKKEQLEEEARLAREQAAAFECDPADTNCITLKS